MNTSMLLTVLAFAGIPAFLGQGPVSIPVVDERIRQEARDALLAMRFKGSSAEECRAWQKEFAGKLRSLLGPHQPPVKWQATVEHTADMEDHRLQEIVLSAPGQPSLPVCVLTPKEKAKGRRAGVLLLHGHGPRGHYAVAKGKSGWDLVKQGYVVVAPCLTPFGRRLGDPAAYGKQDPCGITFIRMQLLGKVLIAENLRDCLWAFEFLARHEEVDPERLACAGLSYGGRMTMLTAALEPRIKVAVISGALNVLQERIEGRYSCGAQVIPGLLQFGDVPEIGSLIAPRTAVWEMGSEDTLIDARRAEAAIAHMRRAYKALNAEGRLLVDRFEGGHTWSWRLAVPLLKKELN